jgi:hypothetical protein
MHLGGHLIGSVFERERIGKRAYSEESVLGRERINKKCVCSKGVFTGEFKSGCLKGEYLKGYISKYVYLSKFYGALEKHSLFDLGDPSTSGSPSYEMIANDR